MAVIRAFDIQRLQPFRREGSGLPKPAPEEADKLADLDPGLKPDEQSYISHYLGYADVLLNESEEQVVPGRQHPNIIELPRMEEPGAPVEPPEKSGDKAKDPAA